MEALSNPWAIPLPELRKHRNQVPQVDVGALIDELERQIKRHSQIRKEISEIE